jgi:epoxide hydrolase 4
MTGLHHDFAEVNGVRLHYVSTGSGHPIFFVHGFPEFWYQWKTQLEDFGRDHRAVAVDLRGYNLSSKPPHVADYRVPLLVEDLRALAGELSRDKLTLVAHDWGGIIAWAFAAQHPEALDRLVIINAPHPAVFERELRHNPAQQQASQYILTFRSPQAEQLIAANNYAMLVETVLGEGLRSGRLKEEDRRAYVEAWSQPGALTAGLNYYRALEMAPAAPLAFEAGRTLPHEADWTIKVPTLVIWGERDIYLLASNLDGLEQFVPRLTVKRILDASHWVVHEQPELVNRLIREFLEATK